MKFRAACIQLRSTTDPSENLKTVERLVREAASRDADYVQTPEMTNVIQRNRADLARSLHPEGSDPFVRGLAALSGELGIFIHAGSLALAAGGGRIANRSLIFGRGGQLMARYDKIHLFDVDLPGGGELARIGRISARRSRRGGRPALAAPGCFYLLRYPLPAALPGASACRRDGAERARRIHPPDGRGSLARPAKSAGDRERRIRDLRGAGRPACRRTGNLRPLDDRVAVGRDPGGSRGAGSGIILADIDPAMATEARQRIPALKNERPFALPDAPSPTSLRSVS
jgi:predicted amidohydrolase